MTRFEHAYVLSIMADDHPGIVAAVTSAVDRLRGNIDSCSQTVLKGYFTLIVLASFPVALDPSELAEAVRGPEAARTGFQVMARPFARALAGRAKAGVERFVVTAFGQDRPGIVLRFSQYLAGKDINIIDLYGDRTGEEFVLISQVEIPQRYDIGMLQADLEEMGNELGFTVRLQHENIFVATNELRLTRQAGQ